MGYYHDFVVRRENAPRRAGTKKPRWPKPARREDQEGRTSHSEANARQARMSERTKRIMRTP